MQTYKTIVGVPFYDGEGLGVLEACLANIDACLLNLEVEAKIVVGINGPRVENGLTPLAYQIKPASYRSPIEFIRTAPGLVSAERTIARRAVEEGMDRIFLTDADIARLPHSLNYLWTQGDALVVGASYAAYPLEILINAGIVLSEQEQALYRIFEATKHPIVREFSGPYQPKKRLKGSLLLVHSSQVETMFGQQTITSDSRMNQLIPGAARQLVPEAAFMFYGRTDVTDHVQARLRHFRAAAAAGMLESFAAQSVIYTPKVADELAMQILAKYPLETAVLANFLIQTALDYLIIDVCKDIIANPSGWKRPKQSFWSNIRLENVKSFNEALECANGLLGLVDWNKMQEGVTSGAGTTNNRISRAPIDLVPLLGVSKYRTLILACLGLGCNVVL